MRSARRIEERFYTEHVKGEWEASAVKIPFWVTNEVHFARFVRELNREAKRKGDYVRYRSIAEEDAFE